RHLPEEEREQKRANVGTVHIRVRHDDHLVVARLLQVELITDSGTDSGNDRADFLIGEHLVNSRLLHVDDLSTQRKDCLEVPAAPLLCRTACRVALYEVELAECGVGE